VQKGCIICHPEAMNNAYNDNCTFLVSNSPRKLFADFLQLFADKFDPVTPNIHPTAIVCDSARVGNNVLIGAHAFIANDVVIGDNCVIGHNTVIEPRTVIGNDVRIGSNCTIGGVGFGFEKNEENLYKRIPHIGNVVIKEKVEIGNNTCIDRAVLGSTIIESNVKIDNLVHIAHNVQIGENTMVIANSMIAGSTKIGQNVWVAPSTSVLNKLIIEDNATLGLGSVIIRDVSENDTVVGNPGRKIL
jgi:UDP-3-O-[3-hydroxymyristoyl] glucosamine N-acyltransferase